MPELPEVETIVRELSPKISGQTISAVKVTGHAVFRGKTVDYQRYIVGSRVHSVSRFGKYIYLQFLNRPYHLQVHLGMTGRLLWISRGASLEPHTHLIFGLRDSPYELRYADIRRFGWLEIIHKKDLQGKVPDAWEASEREIAEALSRARGFVKNALLSQSVIAGLGNIYVDESLYRAKIHPRRRLENLNSKKREALLKSIHSVLKKSIKLGGTSVQNYVDLYGGRGGFKKHLAVYGKAGILCQCRARIQKTVVAGRGTYFCPRCQKAPPRQKNLKIS